jgi:hypothetical protein
MLIIVAYHADAPFPFQPSPSQLHISNVTIAADRAEAKAMSPERESIVSSAKMHLASSLAVSTTLYRHSNPINNIRPASTSSQC